MFGVLARHWRLMLGIVGSMLLACLLYCLIAPDQYEAQARVALRTVPAEALLDANEGAVQGVSASAQTQLETLASVLRGDELAWRVIVGEKLYQAPGFLGRSRARFQGFRPDAADRASQGYLLERFQSRLHVGTLPRTLLIEVRFRSRDPGLSADVVNALIRCYREEDSAARRQATLEATGQLESQLDELRIRADKDDRRLAAFQRKHGLLISPETLENGKPGAAEHLPALLAVDELGRELAAATSDRILREAEFRAAAQGDPEQVLAFDARLQGESGNPSNTFRILHNQHSALEQELAQLRIERGPNFPRVVEIDQQLQDLDKQLETEDTKLRDRFRSAWLAAADHEQLVSKGLKERTGEGLKVNEAAMTYEGMRRDSEATHALYLRLQDKVEEAGMAAGVHSSDIWVTDAARPPAKPIAPDLPMYMAITMFVALWIAVGAALLADSWKRSAVRVLLAVLLLVAAAGARAQAPTPSTSGLPTGVARLPADSDTKAVPDVREAPAVWNAGNAAAGLPGVAGSPTVSPMAAPIAPGDLLDVSEFHTPEFHTVARVSAAGTVKLPLIDEVRVDGLDERGAASAIAAALLARGMLNHPQVFVMITAFVGQDVSVLGEVARPGVYPYTLHHRLLDLISAASGLSPTAGGLVNVYHRGEPNVAHSVELGQSPGAVGAERNPELAPGDTVEVSRVGLVYVVGDVIRPGGFAVDPTQTFTVLKALSLAWGPSQNAAVRKAILIREQKGGRTVTTLNLKRMLQGKDPDQPVEDHDILFVPDSAAKNLLNRTIESAIQSAAGVSIYAGMVYSQRF